jgi:putative DNA primase/helicase
MSTDAAAAYMAQRRAEGQACLAAAIKYRQCFNWSVLANCDPDHAMMGQGHSKRCKNPGKRPWHDWKEFEDRLPTEAEIRSWWAQRPTSNVGMALGPVSGLVRVDVDDPAAEDKLLHLSGGDVPDTLEFTSGRVNGGRGLLYAIPPGVTLKTTIFRPGEPKTELRFQAKGAQTVLPPSRHPSGCLYAWKPGHGPDEIAAALMPAWLVEELRADDRPSRRATAPSANGEKLHEGTRNDTLFRRACGMRGKGWSAAAILAALLAENEEHCEPPLDRDEVEKIAESASSYEAGQERPTIRFSTGAPRGDYHLTDRGNAERVVARHGHDLRFCHPWKQWLVWDGRRWQEDATAEAVGRIKETQAALYSWCLNQLQQLKKLIDEDERNKQAAPLHGLLKHVLKWEQTKAIGYCLESMKSEAGVPILPCQLDSDPFLFNVSNGTIDLRAGQLRPHRREDLLSKLAPVEYAPGAECPLWIKFLERVLGGDRDLIEYLQRVVGHALTGDVTEQSLWFLHGSGQNGKSTFLTLLLTMFGDYGIQSVSELLMQRANETHPTERADLFGRRFVATIETDQGKRMAEALLKQLTGGDAIRARRMRQDFFQFDPTHKLFLAANHRPKVRGTDLAIWRRIKLIPFTVTIPDEEKDKRLLTKLKGELSGVLNWAISGCLAWQRNGLSEPEVVRQATDQYRAEQDALAAFIDECCSVHAELRIQSSTLFDAYRSWSGDREMSPNDFAKHMEEKGYERKRGHGGTSSGTASDYRVKAVNPEKY